MNREFADHSWAAPVMFEDRVFDGYDFSGSNLDNVLFVRCDFRGSRFGGGISGGVGFFGCNFTDCVFDRFDFRRVSVGADGGDFLRCQFIRCNFAGRHFERPHFDSCVFDRCRLRNINFNDSTFRRTTFIGKLEDVTFNGMYRRHDGPHPPIEEVDFSRATLGEFVTFEECDLSSSIPPTGTRFVDLLYQIDPASPGLVSTGSADRIVLHRRSNPPDS